jgi:hypothetical protein
MRSGKIDTIETLRCRFNIDASTAKQIVAVIDGVIAPTTFSIVRESDNELSFEEQVLTGVSYLIDGGNVQRIMLGEEVIDYWVGRGDENDWAMVRNMIDGWWEIACPKTFTEQHVARHS